MKSMQEAEDLEVIETSDKNPNDMCRQRLRLVSKSWNKMCECSQLWRDATVEWEDSSMDEIDHRRDFEVVERLFARHKGSIQKLRIEFRVSQACIVSDLLATLSRSTSLKELQLVSTPLFETGSEDFGQAGLLVMCAVAKLTALQNLYIYGFSVSSSKIPPHEPYNLLFTLGCCYKVVEIKPCSKTCAHIPLV